MLANAGNMEHVALDEALSRVREATRMFEHVPRIVEAHPANVWPTDDGVIVSVCCHDDANERTHLLALPVANPTEGNATEIDGDAVQANAQRVLGAVWN